jgi:aryl-alcohol dehydrogenase-like predicted oxidoreductase
MQYTTLGGTGLVVSRLSLGAMTFNSGEASNSAVGSFGTHGTVYKTNTAAADTMVGQAIDAGINFFDTADVYSSGQSEEILGAALRARRDSVVIATKVGLRTGGSLTQAGLGRRHILWSVDKSLRRLKTDWIDVYIAHIEDPYTPLEETLAALDSVVRAGKVRYLGFSNWSAWTVAAALEIQKANGLARFTHGQVNYTLLARDVERDIVPMMQHYGLGLTVWSPLAGGFLSGKYTRESLKNPENRYSGFDVLPFDKEHGFALVEHLRNIAQTHAASVAQVAIAWLLARTAVTSVIVGAAKLDQLKDNLGAADLTLAPAEIAALDAATPLTPMYPNWILGKMADGPVGRALARG